MSWFDECDLEYLIGDLKDKNAKLRNEVELTKRMYAKVSEDLCAEQADNAKLRELVRDVYALHWSGLDCTECPWIGECDTEGGCPWLGIMHDHMRELGVKVDDDDGRIPCRV